MVSIYDIALFFMNNPFHSVFLLTGIFLIDKDKFFKIIAITFLATLINGKLKTFFGIPLHPSLNKFGFAYPSGHTNMNVVLWGSAFLVFKQKRYLLFPLAIFPLGFMGMNYYNYHNYVDISAAIAEAIITLVFFRYTLTLFKNNYQVCAAGFATMGALIIASISAELQTQWMYLHLGIIAAVTVFWHAKFKNTSHFYRATYLIISCVIIFIPVDFSTYIAPLPYSMLTPLMIPLSYLLVFGCDRLVYYSKKIS